MTPIFDADFRRRFSTPIFDADFQRRSPEAASHPFRDEASQNRPTPQHLQTKIYVGLSEPDLFACRSPRKVDLFENRSYPKLEGPARVRA